MSQSVCRTFLILFAVVPVFQSIPIDNIRRETIRIAEELWRTPNRNLSEALSAIRQMTTAISRYHDIDERQRVFATLSAIYRRTEIVSTYESFLLILAFRDKQNTSDSEWIEFAQHVLVALPTMESIHRTVLDDDTAYGEVIKEHVDNVCESGQSSQQLLHTIYAAIQETYLKIYAMTNSAWLLSSVLQNPNNSYRQKFENLTRDFERISREEGTLVQRYLNTTSRSFWRCDPKVHQDDITYTTIKGLLQGYIVNEVDLSPGGSCQHGCSHFTTAGLTACQGNRCFQRKQCHGRLFDCDFYYSDMRVCLSPIDSSRRYEYIKFNNGTTFGRISDCETRKIDSWWRVLPPSHCTYCFCHCEDHESESDRFVSLHHAVADVSKNKIVTGVRFVKGVRTLYLQIQQGTLLPHGDIDESSLEWVPVNTSAPRLLLSYERRKIDLDDLHAPTGYALTGIRFHELDGRLNTQIMMTPFDYEKGILNKEEMSTYWHGNSRCEHSVPDARREHVLASRNVQPTRHTFPDSTSNSFVSLSPSDRLTDAAQTTIPLIDLQPVLPKSPSILSGAGLYHRGEPDSAGFIGLRIFTLDLSTYFAS